MTCSKPINYKHLIDTRTSPRQSRTTFSVDRHHGVIRRSTISSWSYNHRDLKSKCVPVWGAAKFFLVCQIVCSKYFFRWDNELLLLATLYDHMIMYVGQGGYIFYAGGSFAGAGYCRQCRRRPAILPLQLWQGCQVCVKISAQRLPKVAQFNACWVHIGLLALSGQE